MTRIPRRAAGILAAAAIALTAAGCGGDDNQAADAYVGDVNRIQSQLVAAYQRLASEITSSSALSEDAETFGKLETALATSVERLRKVEAPEEVRRQHAEMATLLDGYRDDLAAAGEALTSGSSERATKAKSDLEEQTTTLSETFSRKIREINMRLSE